MDDNLEQKITEIAHNQHKSLNKTIQEILRRALNLDKYADRKEQFMDLFGVWTKEDQEQFRKNTKDFAQIDPQDWK